MATKYANATGNWSTMTWLDAPAGSATTAPGSGDDVDLNGKTVTVDQTVTVLSIIGAGTLAVSGNQTINAVCGSAGAAWGCTLNGASQTVTVNGAVTAGITNHRLTVSGASTVLNVTGTVTAGGAVRGITAMAGTIGIVGNVAGGGGNGVVNNGATITVSGNVTAPGAGVGYNHLAGTTTITGNVTGGSASGLSISSGTVNLTGTLTDGTASAYTKSGGTFNYTPTTSQTATIGGKVMYPRRQSRGRAVNAA